MSAIDTHPLITVCGATGAQGSSVAQYLLRDGGYRVRVFTRNVDTLKQQGAEVFICDLGEIDQVTAALDGAYAVFGLTNFWEHGEETENLFTSFPVKKASDDSLILDWFALDALEVKVGLKEMGVDAFEASRPYVPDDAWFNFNFYLDYPSIMKIAPVSGVQTFEEFANSNKDKFLASIV
ncbi:unnamed protein product [Rhizoctonia solani]|uniref:NmrA-like domain-containing protein n=1 Tax=Rhizoctonia solani TaxID=456999 RepID=A0A8H3ASY9_9AGAM|nr:unnamed protein product [Rhizoctonia solani]